MPVGREVIRLRSDELDVEVLPDLGGTVRSLIRRSDQAELLWRPPWSERPASTAALPGSAEAVMIDGLAGGWQTLFPNAGEAAVVHGVEWPYDGEARLTPMLRVADDTELVLTGRLIRSPFTVEKRLSLADGQLRLSETMTNVGAEPVETIWGSQLVFGADLLGTDTVVDAAATVVRSDPDAGLSSSYEDITPWPRAYGRFAMVNLRSVPGPTAGETRVAYLEDFTTPRLRVLRPSLDLAVEITWDDDVWPYAGYLAESGGRPEYPWWGAGHFLAITPASSWPLAGVPAARRESATTVWFSAGESRTATLTLRVGPA